MKVDGDEIVGKLLQRLGFIYERPLMFGGDARGVDVVLWTYHDIWRLSSIARMTSKRLERSNSRNAAAVHLVSLITTRRISLKDVVRLMPPVFPCRNGN